MSDEGERTIHEYHGRDIIIRFDSSLCSKSGLCGFTLPQVFRAGMRPWADPDAARADEIAAMIRTCPSGALKFERLDGGPAEEADEEVSIVVRKGGPYDVRGRFSITDHKGRVMREDIRMALCRCGRSGNKPFCDGTHNTLTDFG